MTTDGERRTDFWDSLSSRGRVLCIELCRYGEFTQRAPIIARFHEFGLEDWNDVEEALAELARAGILDETMIAVDQTYTADGLGVLEPFIQLDLAIRPEISEHISRAVSGEGVEIIDMYS